MEIRNEKIDFTLNEDFNTHLNEYHRNFTNGYQDIDDMNVEDYVQIKSNVLNKYMTQQNRDTIVIAISGGIDSAVVLGIVNNAMKQDNSPIKKIVAVTIPDFSNEGVTNQKDTVNLAQLVCDYFDVELHTIDISNVSFNLQYKVEDAIGKPTTEKSLWCKGQITSYLRTPTYYYVTSVLTAQNYKPIIVGTTNYSEGGYIGFFGKASDGMVDVQLISDIYKSEVYSIANYFKIPEEIINRKPTGDMYDNADDEEVFGFSYDFLELYMKEKEFEDSFRKIFENAPENILQMKENVEKMHQYNKHKYLVSSPAVHLNITEHNLHVWNYNYYNFDKH